jgi:hypothetical protein
MYRTRVGNVLRRLLLDGNFETPATFRTEDNDVTRWLTAALSEYSSLREESLRALQVQNTIMQFGIAGIAVLIGVALQNSDPVLSILILLFLVPLLAIFLVNIWAGELTRVVRASNYISGLEERINAVIGGEVPALGWEGWLRRHPEFRLYWYYRAQFVALFVLEAAAIALGGYVALQADFELSHPALLASSIGSVSFAFVLFSIWLFQSHQRRLRRQATQDPPS